MASETRELFLASATVVVGALADGAVGRAWALPSVLEEQTVGGLAGHIARGGVWVVGDYLDTPVSDAPRVDSAVQYYAQIDSSSTPDDHRAIRERGAQVAAEGHAAVCARLDARLEALAPRLRAEPADRIVPVAGGALTIGLDEYLKTRIVEQVVHLDDLARSLDRDPWRVPDAAHALVAHIGIDIALVRHGGSPVVRALYRSRLDPVLPVL
jgi:hypothetical protein